MVMKLIMENDRLPNIVQDFLKHANTLRNLVQKATWEVVEDIKFMLYDRKSESYAKPSSSGYILISSQLRGGWVVAR